MTVPRLRDSPILHVSLRILFPLIVLFSFQLFSYGANSPGGGFQAGVVFGTLIVVLDLLWDRLHYSNRFYGLVEMVGLLLLAGCFVAGWVRTGYPFGGFYGWTGKGLLLSNRYFWLLNLGIFLEVAGSIVLIVRYFLSDTHATPLAQD